MTSSTLETPRTVLRPFLMTDVEAAFAWLSDAEVMRHIPFGPDQTLEQTAGRIARYRAHQQKHGFSKWLILDRKTQAPIGDSGFFYLPDQSRVELGYRLARPNWGRGLATEVAAGWVAVARDWFGLERIHAFAHPDNPASLHIIQKLGFTFQQAERLYDEEVLVHERVLPPPGGGASASAA